MWKCHCSSGLASCLLLWGLQKSLFQLARRTRTAQARTTSRTTQRRILRTSKGTKPDMATTRTSMAVAGAAILCGQQTRTVAGADEGCARAKFYIHKNARQQNGVV
jgi:hypothetical protein